MHNCLPEESHSAPADATNGETLLAGHAPQQHGRIRRRAGGQQLPAGVPRQGRNWGVTGPVQRVTLLSRQHITMSSVEH